VVLPPPTYSTAAIARHVQYEQLIRTQQATLLTAMRAQLKALEDAAAAAAATARAALSASIAGSGSVSSVSSVDDEALLKIARLKNEIAEIEFESQQEVPHKLTSEEAALFYNEQKTYSLRVATLEKHHGQAFSLIIGQCTQLLLDKMKQEKKWEAVSASYDPLELYKLIESVVLKQTEDQYVVAAMWDQYKRVFNAQQGTMSNTQWYEAYCTILEVAESVGCVFANDKTLDYCAQLLHKQPYEALGTADKKIVVEQARDRFIAFGLLRTSNKEHDHLKSALSDDFAKDQDNYPPTPQQSLMLMDKYSKSPTVVTQSEGTSFAQKGKNKGGEKKKSDDKNPKKVEYDKDFYKNRECFRCGKMGHPKSACTVKLKESDDDDKSVGSKRSGSSSEMVKAVGFIKDATKQLGKAMTQVTETFEKFSDDNDSIAGQSHAQLGRIISGGSGVYAFASRATSLKDFVLLDNQSTDNIFCNPHLVFNIRRGDRQLDLESNGGILPISQIANIKGFEQDVCFSKKAITNILSLRLVKREYPVSYDGEDFIVHRASHGYPDMVFKPHPTGLHVLDINDPRSHASYAFVETVADNMQLFTKRQIAGGNLARDLQAGLAYPSDRDLKWITQANMLKDNPVKPQDVDVT